MVALEQNAWLEGRHFLRTRLPLLMSVPVLALSAGVVLAATTGAFTSCWTTSSTCAVGHPIAEGSFGAWLAVLCLAGIAAGVYVASLRRQPVGALSGIVRSALERIGLSIPARAGADGGAHELPPSPSDGTVLSRLARAQARELAAQAELAEARRELRAAERSEGESVEEAPASGGPPPTRSER
jgi:hypothetical protein